MWNFPSAVAAVECAVEIQCGMVERDARVPVGKHIEFRIGINLGDVIIDGDDIYRDGVNVAARLEGLPTTSGNVEDPGQGAAETGGGGLKLCLLF